MGEFWNTGRMAFDDVAGMADAALELRRFVVSPFSTNCYAVVSCGKAMVVDPGAEGARIAEALSDVDVELVVATHGHADHVGGVTALVAATGARFAISVADADLARHARRAHAFGIEYDDDAPEPDELEGRFAEMARERGLGVDAPTSPDDAIREGLAAGEPKSKLAKRVAKAFGLDRAAAYDRVVEISHEVG